MIRFVCTCGNRLEVPDDQAGNSIQCPACGLLTDVPTLSEVGQFTDDGIYKLDANTKPAGDDPDRMVELEIIYSKDKRDAEGNEIDLRTLPGARRIRASSEGDDDTGELDFADEPDTTTRPKYDPETGELIRPLEIKKDPDKDIDPSTIPVAKAALSYAGGDVVKPVSPLGAAVELLMPVNMLVMTVVVCVHIFAAMMATVALQVLFFIVPAWLFVQALILSHYGNVIDDIGRNEADDLPRPLRDLSWYDDLWSPFVAMFGGLMITFGVPIFALAQFGEQAGLAGATVGVVLALVGFVVGTLIGPAVLLTTNTSGSAFNLRPDRLLHVVRICGWHYIGVTLLWAITWPVFMLGWFGVTATMVDTFALTLHRFGPPGGWFVSGPALLIGTFLMHWFCWYLGLLYRAHHHQFPWVLQRHVRDPNRKRVNHADKLRARRPVSGHLAIPTAPAPPPSPPSSQSR